jgi:hypothetical protein
MLLHEGVEAYRKEGPKFMQRLVVKQKVRVKDFSKRLSGFSRLTSAVAGTRVEVSVLDRDRLSQATDAWGSG